MDIEASRAFRILSPHLYGLEQQRGHISLILGADDRDCHLVRCSKGSFGGQPLWHVAGVRKESGPESRLTNAPHMRRIKMSICGGWPAAAVMALLYSEKVFHESFKIF